MFQLSLTWIPTELHNYWESVFILSAYASFSYNDVIY